MAIALGVLLDTGAARLLIDPGAFSTDFETLTGLDAVLVTHEHSDHVCGLVSVCRRDNIPVFMTRLTAGSIPWNDYTPRLDCFQAGARFTVGDFEVQSFTTPHDAIDPVGFTIRAKGVQIGIVTDLGYVPGSIKVHLRGTDLLLMESNHDLDMLANGDYSFPLKRRIASKFGHLDNGAAAGLLEESAALANETGDPFAQYIAQLWRAVHRWQRGEYGAARAAAEACLAAAQRLEQPHTLTNGWRILANIVNDQEDPNTDVYVAQMMAAAHGPGAGRVLPAGPLVLAGNRALLNERSAGVGIIGRQRRLQIFAPVLLLVLLLAFLLRHRNPPRFGLW